MTQQKKYLHLVIAISFLMSLVCSSVIQASDSGSSYQENKIQQHQVRLEIDNNDRDRAVHNLQYREQTDNGESQVQAQSLRGDANEDGYIDAVDITIVERMIAGYLCFNESADVNRDGNINSLDIIEIERLIIGLGESTGVITLRMVLSESANDWITLANLKMANEFNLRAKGYRLVLYPGNTLVTSYESIDGVRTGAVEMMDTNWAWFAGANPVFGTLELPLLYNNIDANATAQAELLPIMDKAFRKYNQKALSCYNIGALEMVSVKPVYTIDDWGSMVVQSNSPGCSSLITSLGGRSSSIPFTECYSALQKKTIEAAVHSLDYIRTGKLYEVARYAVYAYLIPATHGWTINLDVWNNMDTETQELLIELTNRYAETQNDTARERYYKLADELQSKYGMEVITIDNAEREIWREACLPHVEEVFGKLGEDGATIKALAEKVNSEYPNE